MLLQTPVLCTVQFSNLLHWRFMQAIAELNMPWRTCIAVSSLLVLMFPLYDKIYVVYFIDFPYGKTVWVLLENCSIKRCYLLVFSFLLWFVLCTCSSFHCAGILSEVLNNLCCYKTLVLNLYWYYCRVRREERSYKIPEFPQISEERILCIGSNNKQPVLKWENNMAWPGKLTLTDKAIYFEVWFHEIFI